MRFRTPEKGRLHQGFVPLIFICILMFHLNAKVKLHTKFSLRTPSPGERPVSPSPGYLIDGQREGMRQVEEGNAVAID